MNKPLQTVLTASFAALQLFSAGCSVMPSSPGGDTPAASPAAEPSPAPAQTTAVSPKPPVAAPAPRSESPKAEKPVTTAAVKPSAAAAPLQKPQTTAPPKAPAAAPLALDTLEQRLKDTPAIGVFTKLTLKNQVDELLDRFRDHHAGRGGATMAQLRQSYEQLLGKVQGLLKDGDPNLASAIAQSREAIWNVLTDPAKFAKL